MAVEQAGSVLPNSRPSVWRQRLIKWSPRTIGFLVLLFLAYLGVDFASGIKLLRHARPEYFMPAFGVYLLSVIALITTWVLIAGALRVGYQKTLSYVRVYLFAMFAGLAVPQGAASFTRLAVIAADRRSVGRGLIAVGVERIVVAVVAIAVLLISSIYLSTLSLDGPRWFPLGIGLLVTLVIFLLVSIRMGLTGSLVRCLESQSRIKTLMGDMRTAVAEVRHLPHQRLAKILAAAFLAALLDVTTLFLCSRALDLNINFLMIMAAWSAVSLTTLLPISINGFGPREGILTAAVTTVGISGESGVALGLLWFIMQALARLTGGLVFFTVLHKSRESSQPKLTESRST